MIFIEISYTKLELYNSRMGIPYRNFSLYLNFVPALISMPDHLTFPFFPTVYTCFDFKKYTSISKFPFRAQDTPISPRFGTLGILKPGDLLMVKPRVNLSLVRVPLTAVTVARKLRMTQQRRQDGSCLFRREGYRDKRHGPTNYPGLPPP
jgi:hypothetical protein